MSGKTALILGSTGQTGAYLLQELLNSPNYTRVLEAGRRVTAAEKLPASAKGKLEQRVIDFEKLDEAKLGEGEGFDVVYITLGTTLKNAGSAAKFEKIDREYVVNAARAAKASDTTRSQRLVYLCSQMANPRASVLYSRSKGLTEQALAELGYSDCIIFRPGFLGNTNRSDSRPLERIAAPIVGLASWFSSSVAINIDTLAKSMRIAGTLGSDNLPASAGAHKTNWGGKEFTVITNSGSLKLAKENL